MAANKNIKKAGFITSPAFFLAIFGAGCESPPSTEVQHLLWFLGHPRVFTPLALIGCIAAMYFLVRKFGRPRGIMGLWVCGGAFIAIAGLITGLNMRMKPVTFGVNDTYYVTAHFQSLAPIVLSFVIVPGLLILTARGLHRPYSLLLARLQFWLYFVGVSALILPQYFLSMSHMPQSYIDYAETFSRANLISLIGAMIILLSLATFVIVIVEALVRKRPVPHKAANPIASTFE